MQYLSGRNNSYFQNTLQHKMHWRSVHLPSLSIIFLRHLLCLLSVLCLLPSLSGPILLHLWRTLCQSEIACRLPQIKLHVKSALPNDRVFPTLMSSNSFNTQLVIFTTVINDSIDLSLLKWLSLKLCGAKGFFNTVWKVLNRAFQKYHHSRKLAKV